MAKESKNLAKVQDMLDGNYKSKIQSGYSPVQEHRKVGDKWTDSEGYKWIQHEGYKEKLRSTVESKVTADTVRKLKTSQGANNATTEEGKVTAKATTRGVAQKVKPQKRNFFAR